MHANTIWRYSSHGQRELLHLYVLTLLISILDIDSCLLLSWIELHLLLALLWSYYMCVSMSPQKLLCYHLSTRGRAEIKLGMLIRPKRIYNFCLFHALLGDIVICFATLLYHFTHIWINLLTQCTQCQFLFFPCFWPFPEKNIKHSPNGIKPTGWFFP